MKITIMLKEALGQMKRMLPGRYVVHATDLRDDSCVINTAKDISDILGGTRKRVVLEMGGASANKRIRLVHAANIAVSRQAEDTRRRLKDRIIINYAKVPSVASIYKSVVFGSREANQRILKKYKIAGSADSKEES